MIIPSSKEVKDDAAELVVLAAAFAVVLGLAVVAFADVQAIYGSPE